MILAKQFVFKPTIEEGMKFTQSQKYIKNIKAAEKTGRWKIVGIDPDGFDLRKKKLLTRLFFDREISDSKKLRGMFVKLHKEALKD